MTIAEFKQVTKSCSQNSEIVFFPEGSAIDQDNTPLMPGIGYFDLESKEYVYLGDIVVLEDEE